MSEKTIYPITHIVSMPGVVGGKPRIDGTRISVQFISMFSDGSRSVEDLCEDYGLTPAQIYAAWSYYFDHKAEIDQAIEDEENYVRPDAAEHESIVAAMRKRYEERQKLASEG